MRFPRDLLANDLAQVLRKLGHSGTRQTGSHLRLTTFKHGEYHLTIPLHASLRVGTLSAISWRLSSGFPCLAFPFLI